jgi:predicted Mrr-cat superfamily restriction endonuclease
MARAGKDNELAGELKKHDVVAIGWDAIGNLSDVTSRSKIKDRYTEAYPDHSNYLRGQAAGQLYRFALAIEEDDFVLTYLKAERLYRVGRIDGPYSYRPEIFDSYPHIRPVDWLATIPRVTISLRLPETHWEARSPSFRSTITSTRSRPFCPAIFQLRKKSKKKKKRLLHSLKRFNPRPTNLSVI